MKLELQKENPIKLDIRPEFLELLKELIIECDPDSIESSIMCLHSSEFSRH